MNLSIPKFHNRKSLMIGFGAGLFLMISGMFHGVLSVGLIQVVIGGVLAIHCLDTLRYYKRHRIIKIEKTDTERVIYKDNDKNDSFKTGKVKSWFDALRVVWKQSGFKIMVILCTLGIAIGLWVGIGMTNLVLLVAIALLGWGMEIANTAVEMLLDIVHPDYSPKVKIVKDAFATVPKFTLSAYVICWLILVAPNLYMKVVG